MYTKILTVLLLYVYAAGEDGGGHNQSKDYLKEITESYTNYSSKSEVLIQPTRQSNKRQGVIRRTYDSNIFKLLAPIKEENISEISLKDDLQPNEQNHSELQVPTFLISINNHSKNTAKASHENNSPELIQADGTYNVQHYVRPPFMNNQYQMQHSPSYSNLETVDNRQISRIDPCLSGSASQQYMQQNNYGRRSFSEYDPYQAQGTYNVQYYTPSHQQRKQISIEHQRQVAFNNWRRLNYKNQVSSVNPCLPNQPRFASFDRQYIQNYPNPPKPRNIYSPPEQNIHPNRFPPSNIRGNAFPSPQIYRDAFPPRNIDNFQIYPPKTVIEPYLPHRIPGGMKGFITLPPYTIKPLPPIYTPTPGSRTKSFTPTRPKVTPRPYTPTWPKGKPPIYTPIPGSRTKSYTPTRPKVTPRPYTPIWPKGKPPVYSPTPGRRTKSYTPPRRKTTQPTPYSPPGRKTTPTCYTPPGRKTTPTCYSPPGLKTPPPPRSRSKGY